MEFDLKTDWSKVEVEEDDGVFRFERLDNPEVGCVCCGGYAEWRVVSTDHWSHEVRECSTCILEGALDPTYPGTFHYHP